MQFAEIRNEIITSSASEIKRIRAAARKKLDAIKVLESELGVTAPAENKGITALVRGQLPKMTGTFTARDIGERIKVENGREFPVAAVRSTLKWLELKDVVAVYERGVPRSKETKYVVPAKADVEVPF